MMTTSPNAVHDLRGVLLRAAAERLDSFGSNFIRQADRIGLHD